MELADPDASAKRARIGELDLSKPGAFAHFSMGKKTYVVPMAMHAESRAKLVAAMRAAGHAGVVVLQGGEAACRDDTDHELDFRQESYFHYLFGVREPEWWGAIDLATGAATLFMPRLPDTYAI